jgi:hypothetical protein
LGGYFILFVRPYCAVLSKKIPKEMDKIKELMKKNSEFMCCFGA